MTTLLWPKKKTLEDIELTIAIHMGRFLHWAAISLVGILWLGEFIGIFFGNWPSSNFVIGMILLGGIALIMIGRGLRFALAKE